MTLEITPQIRAHIKAALAEDRGTGDVTTDAIIRKEAMSQAVIVTRQNGVMAGQAIAAAVFAELDPAFSYKTLVKDGKPMKAGQKVARLSGKTRALLTAERVALNYLQHLSGIASYAQLHVAHLKGTKAKLLDTRKTVPGLRVLEKYAVRCGGGKNHRLDLSERILIKDNHIAAAGSITEAVKLCRKAPKLHIQVECETLREVKEALAAGADSLLLDNMTPARLRQAVKTVRGRVPVEASGGISLDNLRKVAQTGVDFISMGRLTQSAPALDLSLEILD